MRKFFFILNITYLFCLTSFSVYNYIELLKLKNLQKKDYMKKSKIIDAEFWSDLYE